MPRYVIEREIPEAGQLNQDALETIAQKSCDVINGLDTNIQRVQSYVTDDKIYCEYIVSSEDAV